MDFHCPVGCSRRPVKRGPQWPSAVPPPFSGESRAQTFQRLGTLGGEAVILTFLSLHGRLKPCSALFDGPRSGCDRAAFVAALAGALFAVGHPPRSIAPVARSNCLLTS